MRIVVDTNVLIDGFQDDNSSEAKLIDAVRSGSLTAVATPKVIKEYRLILGRLISDKEYRSRIEEFLFMLEETEPEYVDIRIDDEEDMKFLEAAVGGEADIVVTSDRHLLDVGEVDGVRIITPEEAWRKAEDELGGSDEWHGIVEGWGIASHGEKEE